MVFIQLSQRQEMIIAIVKKEEPITGEKIADLLHVTRAALRSDLVVLTMLGLLDAKPKVGYFYQGETTVLQALKPTEPLRVSDVMGIPVTAHQNDSVYDVIVSIFLEDTGGIFILDKDDYLCGVVSRKDLLKATIGGGDLTKLPIGMIMTRIPNITTVAENESVKEATQKLVSREVDSLPVVRLIDQDPKKMQVVGKFSKTIITRLFLDC
ncbi:helix-turn-helix transcriptional regulator [Streptococcus iniae]|uniref:helix-turn-helix transcriptional regulator n=1 Tax=Streptococcus iniae TaxID=1346 RepID=UPI002B2E877C|nr:helix-turn-helix transcriptional regulator [Streptococcus iniae]WNZ92408.1 helix-turn-helix transcriptional regulator [Streptococcus iniae]WNZ95320.1 helix-turn-helix transcriptional regulator [Streptococcus iniae]WNZ96957.1 helix-turn-helix transcriptional regulator [Streptococcus iniae]